MADSKTTLSDRVRAVHEEAQGTDGRVRAVIDAVRPCIDGGRFAAKRTEGEIVTVEADCFADGQIGRAHV